MSRTKLPTLLFLSTLATPSLSQLISQPSVAIQTSAPSQLISDLPIQSLSPSLTPTPSSTSTIPRYTPTGSSTIIAAYFPGNPLSQLLASVLSANPTATTYALNCPPLSTDCGILFPTATLSVTPLISVYEFIASDATFTASFGCTASIGGSLACVESFGGAFAVSAGDVRTTMYNSDEAPLVGFTVTGGLEKIAEVTGVKTSSSASVAGGSTSSSGTAKPTGSTGGASRLGGGSGMAVGLLVGFGAVLL